MKKKVFSLMMTLVLAFMGMAQAQVSMPYVQGFENGMDGWTMSNCHSTSGVTTTSSYVYSGSSAFAFHWTTNPPQYLISPELNVTGNGNWEFYYKSAMSSYIETFEVGYSTTTNAISAFTFGTEITAPTTWTQFTDVLPAGTKYVAIKCTSYDKYYLCLDDFTFTAAGGGGDGTDQLHVKYMNGEEEVIDALDLGVRPIGAWMEPFNFTMYTEGAAYTVNVLDFTPSDGMFTVAGEELPFQVTNNNDVALNMTTNGTEAGVIDRQFVAITEGDRAAHIWPVTVELYDPAIPDVWEKACTQATTFPFVEVPATTHNTTLHNDYTLPFPEIPEGYDAVYKLVFAQDTKLNAEVTTGADGKVALYTEDFNGEGGPMATNNYAAGGSSSAAPFEAQIGEGTTYTTYFPFYTYYNYNIAENLYLATELEEAGVTTAPMTSLSWYANNAPGYNQQGITIWMANVPDTELTTTSHVVTGMTKVYTGSMTPAIGWNEFVFNEGTFSWDGLSNVLIYVQRNNGTYNSSVQWRATASYPFNAMAYRYQDSGAYDPTVANPMYTSTTRPDIIMKAANAGRNLRTNTMSYGPVIADAGIEAGTYYLVASSTDADFQVTINAEAMPCPDLNDFAFGEMPADDEDHIEPALVTLKWNNPAYATEYQVHFGSTYYPEAGHPQTVISDWRPVTGPAGSFNVTNLWHNTNYFWYVVFRNSGACTNGVESPHWGFTTHLNIPMGLSVSDETVFNDETITLSWNPVVDRTYRMYNVYRDGVKIGDTYDHVNEIGYTTFTDGPLAYNMDGYTYQVTAIYDEGESDLSDPVIVKVSGYGNVSGHVYEQDGTTGIANATVTMSGQDEFGDSHTYTFTTDADGYYVGHIYTGSYNGSAACNGYQSMDEPVQGNPIAITYNNMTTPVDYILDENFYTPCSVVAQYYPDSTDVNAPYVKVYWGCGLPGTLFEPFETGDFSQYDWQLDPVYPWSITTTNPYEGTYCMKSGGAGVANVTSNMTVTVNIPADGEMSFFGKISCESSYDKGHFLIDGMEMGTYTGSGSWGERTFPITAGDHIFQWRYTKDSSVNSYDDCFYVDNITFYRRPEPPQPGWVYYDDGVNVDAIGLTAGGSFYWGVMFPAGHYVGNTVTKVSMYDYSAHTGNILVYQGGTNAPGTLLGQQAYTCTGSADFVEWTLNTPITIDPSQNLWIVMNNNDGQYVASGCANTGDSNGRWISLDGTEWEDVATYGLDYTWMIRAYVDGGAKGEYIAPMGTTVADVASPARVKGEKPNIFSISGKGTAHNVGVPTRGGDRAFSHYRVYRTNCYNDGPYTEDNTVVLACELLDTLYIDVSWPDAAPGVYKWGVGCVYVGNRGEEVESDIEWSQPVVVAPEMANRDEFYDFENGQIPAGWTNDATYPWTVVNTAPQPGFNGTYCIMSGNSGVSGSTSSISTTVNYDQAGTVSFLGGFWGEGSSDSYDWDKCRFYIDGNIMIDYGAHDAWENVSFPVTAGNHIFTWTYKKDGSVNPTGDAFFIDDVAFVGGNGGGGGGNSGSGYGPGNEPIQEPRESVIVWSNCLDKDMYLNNVTVNVLLNSADSPEGTLVDFTNMNEYEQETYPIAQLTLDQTGYYAFESFRRGEYAIRVQHEGYEPIFDTVSIWENTDLRYVMIEILFGVRNIYVSRTGWAMWEDVEGEAPIVAGGLIDFETGDFSQFDFNNSVSNYPWIVTNSGAYEGTYCMKSTNNGVASSTSAIEATVNYAADGTVSFMANCMGEGTATAWDKCIFKIDGVSKFEYGAHVSGWNEYSYPVTAGQHVFRWEYTKDSSVNPSGDAMFVDNIVFEGGRVREDERHFEFYKVMCTSIDGVPIYNHNTVHPFCQLSYNEPYNAPLVEGEHYLCKVASVYSTGVSAWSDPVEWVYEPCEHWGPVDEVAVTTGGQGNHIEWVFEHGVNPYDDGQGGGGGGQGSGETSFTEGFEGSLNGWNVLTVNAAGGHWIHSNNNMGGYDYTTHAHGGSGFAMCYSFVDYDGAYDTDSYLYTPQKYDIVNGSTLTFFADNANDSYPESFSVCVATADNPTASDFVTVWSGSAKDKGGAKANVRHDGNRYDNWRSHSVNLSAYAGQSVWIAFHDVNYDMYEVWIDDVQLTAGAKGGENGEVNPYYMVGANLEFNLNSIPNYNERVYFLYNLYKDSRFNVVNAETAGRFLVSASESYIDLDLEEAFNDFRAENAAQYGMMDKVQAAQKAAELKPALPSEFMQSLFTYDYVRSRENDACNLADPACSDSTFFFPAPVGSQTAESGPDYDCLYTQPRPVWYYFQIDNPGAIEIYMYSNPQIDIDFCCWGPFDDPITPCPYGLTGDKVVDCSYSTSWNETCNIPATAQTGEYYIMVITNYNGGSTNITFSQVGGSGTTNCEIVTPTTDIIGFLITQDGEYLDIVGPNVREYTDIDEFGDHEYCVRPIYPGEMVLPDHNYGWSMGCPVCATPNGSITCDAYMPIHGEAVNGDQVKIWWGEQNPGPGPGETSFTEGFEGSLNGWNVLTVNAAGGQWIHSNDNLGGYDYTTHAHGGSGFAMCYSFVDYDGAYDTDSYLYTPQKYDIVNGSTLTFFADNANDSYPESFSVCVATADNPTASDFVAVWNGSAKDKGGAKANVRHDGNRYDNWRSHTVDLSAYAGQSVWIAFHDVNYDMYEVWIDDVQLTAGAKNRANVDHFNVYRSTNNVDYVLLNTVAYVDGQTYYEYIDTPAGTGTYYYQVTTVYDNDCESDPAVNAENPANDYVMIGVTGIDENSDKVALYPNPTKGNVTIEANGMSRITVVSVLGQVVFDTELDADVYTLNMAQFNAGMYMVRVYTEEGVVVKRVTVMQ
jgi:hypothetical protein